MNFFNALGEKKIPILTKSFETIVNEINSTKEWNLRSSRKIIEQLYEYKRLNFLNQKDKHIEENIDFYIDYMNHQNEVLESFENHVLILIATIFLPCSFIVGFYGMNFKSMGVPSLRSGIFTIEQAQLKILFVCFSIGFLITEIFYYQLKFI